MDFLLHWRDVNQRVAYPGVLAAYEPLLSKPPSLSILLLLKEVSIDSVLLAIRRRPFFVH